MRSHSGFRARNTFNLTNEQMIINKQGGVRAICLMLGSSVLMLTNAGAQSTKYDALLTGSQWYVPTENLLAYTTGSTSLTPVLPFADQTLWEITSSSQGVFTGLTDATFTVGTNILAQSFARMDGVITDAGQVRIKFTATNGSTTIGIGQERIVDGTSLMQMQMITGESGTYVVHWAYMAPYEGSTVPPTTLPTNQTLISEEWQWMEGTTWSLINLDLFDTAASGTFSVTDYVNGYFWGHGTGPTGGSIDQFSFLGSATPEGNILLSVMDSADFAVTSLTGLITGDATNGSMGLRSYTFDATGLDAGRAQIVPEPLTTGLLGLAAAMALTVRRRPRSI